MTIKDYINDQSYIILELCKNNFLSDHKKIEFLKVKLDEIYLKDRK